MVKLRKITEAVDSSHSSIMYNLADTLKRKGWDATYIGTKGMQINFSFPADYDPHFTKDGKLWLKANPDKDFVFKGTGLSGFFYWDIIKNNSGMRDLVTKDLKIRGKRNLISIQNPKDLLNGQSVKPFTYPKPYTITNLLSPTTLSYLNKLKDTIINSAALALSEVVALSKSSTKESKVYFIDYDDNYNRVNEGYLVEAESDKDNNTETEEEKKSISWKDDYVQKAITDTIKGLKVNKSKTTDKELIFTYNGKNGSLHLQGYMLVLDTDTDDNIPATNYPVKDKNNLTIENLLDTIKTVFSRRESVNKDIKEAKESHLLVDDIEPENEEAYYVLKGYIDEFGVDYYDEIVGEEEGYSTKDEAIKVATDLRYKNPKSVYGVTELVNINYFINDTFWDALDEDIIKVVWNTLDLSNSNTALDVVDEKRVDEEEDLNDEDPTIETSMVFQDVAKERFLDRLSKSLIIAPAYEEECAILDSCDKNNLVWLYLSPSYAIDQVSNIVLPLCITGRKISMPVADMPDPNSVFDGGYTENSLSDYDNVVQKYILNDAPMSDVAVLDLENADDVKAHIVDLLNTMADGYINKKKELSDNMDLKGDAILKESRYFIVPEDTNLESDKEVVKITPLGYTDLNIAKNELSDMAKSGRYEYGLKILDTNFSENKENWKLL